MLDWSDCPKVERSGDRVSGAWVFRGTRVPLSALFENLQSGATIEQFLEWFPGVSIYQVTAVLTFAEQQSCIKRLDTTGFSRVEFQFLTKT
jgi:uncharacterized protein (DUF433 family)